MPDNKTSFINLLGKKVGGLLRPTPVGGDSVFFPYIGINSGRLNFLSVVPNALNAASVLGTESPQIDCADGTRIVAKIEYSTNVLTAQLAIFTVDVNGIKVYSEITIPNNLGINTGVSVVGCYHGNGLRVFTNGAKYCGCVLLTDLGADSINVWLSVI